LYEQTLDLLFEHDLLKRKGIIVCEHSANQSIQFNNNFKLLKYKSYGETGLTFLAVNDNREEKQQ
ncbi:MAG: RsmD family RNA methyltransferase, partial [Desulfobacterales bacterium]|nr:RsmD family RNA methyltransferase [Desulfobacterales bacterium]